ncbi:MAG TPA: hypothetical protein VHP14_15360 [Anaerolineales bacterium]|nr:hypothetical protein [Anaerolineales bacterium]
MKRKTWLIAGAVLGILLCVGVAVGWGVYSLMNNPSVKKGLEAAGVEFEAMLDLQLKIAETYTCEDLSIQIMNGNTLNVSLINSGFNELSPSQQVNSAREVAQFVKENYTGNIEFDRIVIIFVKNAKTGPLNTNQSFSYPFEVSELE